ncbi:MAG: cupredoxin domain-containing protein [Candidatus Magasanikbacteria bacterium]
MKKALIGLTIAVVAGGAVLFGISLGGNSNGSSTNGSATVSGSSNADKVVEVSGTEYSFSPSKIRVKKGQKVKVKFTNTGSIGHNLVIPSLNVGSEVIGPGQTDSFVFTADKSGSYPIDFECSVPGHAQSGMVGQVMQS